MRLHGFQKDFEDLLLANPIFRGRMEGTGVLPKEELIALGVTGPLLRAAGVPLDLRRVDPYLVYDRLDFDVPIGESGDNMDRFLVRCEEIRQSARMIEQCLVDLPGGAVDIDAPRIRLPAKDRVFTRMEELISQFKLVTEGPRPPVGEVYQAVEGGNGELGFYLVSDGSGKPYKCRDALAELLEYPSDAAIGGGRNVGGRDSDLRHDQHDWGRV